LRFSRINGFSLLEMVIATALLGLVLVTIGSVFAKGLEALKKGQKNGVALHITQKKIEEVINIDLADPDFILREKLLTSVENYDPAKVSITPSGSTDLSWNDTFDTLTVEGTEEVGGNSYDFNIKIEGYRPGLKKVSVTLKWVDVVLKDEKTMEIHTLLCRKGTIDYEYQ